MKPGQFSKVARKLPGALLAAFKHGISIGYCPICERRTGFLLEQAWHREYFRCLRCFSNARMRSFMTVLETEFPDWKQMAIHESSPSGPVAARLARDCAQYSSSYFFVDAEPGSFVAGKQCQDLESLTFAESSFDLFITQDVLEHVMNPARAFKEIARVLKPGGVHIFTVPWAGSRATGLRATLEAGQVRHLKPPEYHGNPINSSGSLVVTDWGHDMVDMIFDGSGLHTRRISPQDHSLGIIGECLDVFVSYKRLDSNADNMGSVC